MRAIHQFIAGFTAVDAISNEARLLREIFRNWGSESHIYCERRHVSQEYRADLRDVTEVKSIGADDIVLLHLSSGTPLNDLFIQLPCRKALLYHNITPPEYFHGIQDQIALSLEKGREQMAKLASHVNVAMADSAFNAAELEAAGFEDVRVLPLILNMDDQLARPDRPLLRQWRDGMINILFVGRGVPNKRLEDILQAFYYFQRYVCPESRLIHAGSFIGVEAYQAMILSIARRLKMSRLEMTGPISQRELTSCYQAADLFLCMSEHEGFCIPLLEAMQCNVPVMAYDAAAVPETMNGAGVLFRKKEFELIAEMMGCLSAPGPLREAVLRGQQARLKRFKARNPERELRENLAVLL